MKWGDRIEALKRSKKYRKDYKEYEADRIKQGFNEYGSIDIFEQQMSEKARSLCDKYHIPYPINPKETAIHDPSGKVVGQVGVDDNTPAIRVNRARLGEDTTYGHVKQDGKFITIQITIDTSKTQEQIEDEFKNLYKHLFTQGPKKERSPRTYLRYQGKKIDHWLVYDMVEKGESPSSIMKKFFGVTEKPSLDEKAMARYKQIKRYYDKAVSLIGEFEGEHSSNQ